MLRGSGGTYDSRIAEPYETYSEVYFSIPIGKVGDCYDRYLIRMEEMRQSVKIISKSINLLKSGIFKSIDYKITSALRIDFKTSMEAMIHHFKYHSEGMIFSTGETYTTVEAPKGEFGIYAITNNTNKLYRCKIKAPGFSHLQALNAMSKNHLIADVVTIIGTQDIVFGEVDR